MADPQHPNKNVFQLTTSRRGRRTHGKNGIRRIVFQLTTSRRGRQRVTEELAALHNFQLTTSRRGRLLKLNNKYYRETLSTHDLTQRSTESSKRSVSFCILSTHDLTQRSTSPDPADSMAPDLSTHDLTQRSTESSKRSLSFCKTFNSRPHAEVDL